VWCGGTADGLTKVAREPWVVAAVTVHIVVLELEHPAGYV